MSKGTLKNLGVRATPEFIEHLDNHLTQINFTGNRTDYVLNALVEKLKSESGDDIPPPKAPNGVRTDARPNGWKSRLYPDRYQLVAIADLEAKCWIFHQLHTIDVGNIEYAAFGLIRADMPHPVEVAVYCPANWRKSDVKSEIGLELMLPDWEHLFDRG
jgi:hypothetical protein